MPDDTAPTISIDPPLTLDDVKDGPELRTIELIHLRAGGERFPVEPWTANTIDARDSGMNYYPHFIVDELQQVVDYYADREFAGCIEVRNSSPSMAPVFRCYVRERRVEMVAPTLMWPGEQQSEQQRAELQDLLGSIWLYAEWRWITRQLTTEQKELWADAVDARSAIRHIEDGEDVHPVADRWWRDA